jgi:hypothetical protein
MRQHKAKKNVRRGFVDWLVRILKPGHHVAKNPKPHTKVRKSTTEASGAKSDGSTRP